MIMRNPKMRFSAIITIVFAIAIYGCASFKKADRDSRQTALVTYQQVLTFKQEINKKIAAERRYYRQTIKTLDNSRSRTDYAKLRRSVIIAAQKDSEAMIKKPKDITGASVAVSLTKKAKDLVDTFETGVEQLREQRQANEASLKELNKLGAQYGALEKTLLELTIPLDRRDHLERVARFISDVTKYYKELEKAEETQEQPSQ